MPEQSQFIIEILLQAKDHATAQVAALRAEIEALRSGASRSATDDLTRGLDDVEHSGRKATTSTRELGEAHARSGTAAKASARDHEQLGNTHQKVSRDVDGLRKSLEDVGDEMDQGSKRSAALAKKVSEVTSAYDNLDEQVKSGSIGLADARREYTALGNELNKLSQRFKVASDDARSLRALGEEAKAQARAMQALSAASRQAIDEETKATVAARSAQVKADQVAARQRQKIANDMVSEVRAALATQSRLERKAAEESIALEAHKEATRSAGIVERGRVEAAAAARVERDAREAAKSATRAAPSVRTGASGGDDAVGFMRRLSGATDDVGIKVVSLSAKLRGLFLALGVGLAQQLDTAIVSLGGSMISLASAAGQAGAVVGGAFAAGIGQAIPVVTVLLGAVNRLKAVFGASNLATQIQQQNAADPTKAQQTQLQNIDQITNAQNALSNSYTTLYDAQQRVRDSTAQLTQARIDAIRNVTDLTMAEKDAQLAQAGAHLSLAQAQQDLQRDITRGVTGTALSQDELAIQQARLGATRSDIAVPRSEADAARAQARGVGRNPSVISAGEGVRAARNAVVTAQQGIDAAKRQLRIQQLQATTPQGQGITSTQSSLNLLLSQMSGPEKQLYNSITDIKKNLTDPNGPLRGVTDAIVQPFADAVSQVDVLLRSPKVQQVLQPLADAVGKGEKQIFKRITGPQGQQFFETMAADATKNTPLVAGSISHIIDLFQSVATAASPALGDGLQSLDTHLSHLDKRWSSATGLQGLEHFFSQAEVYAADIEHLGGATGKLMLALGGAAAPSGGTLITDLTGQIQKATSWITNNGDKVQRFFDQARQGTEQLAKILFTLAQEMLRVFSLDSLKAFTQFMDEVFLPGLRDVINVVGFVAQAVLGFFNLFGTTGRKILEGFGVVLGGLFLAGKFYDPVMKARAGVLALYDAIKVLRATGSATAAWDALTARFKKVETSAKTAAAEVDGLTASEEEARAVSVSGGVAPGAARTAERDAAAAAGGGGSGLLARLGIGGAGAGAAAYLGPAAVGLGIGYLGTQGLNTLEHQSAKGRFGLPKGGGTGGLLRQVETGFTGDDSKAVVDFGNALQAVSGHLDKLPLSKLIALRTEARQLSQTDQYKDYRKQLDEVSSTMEHFIGKARQQRNAADDAKVSLRNWADSLTPVAKIVNDSFSSINAASGSILGQVKDTVAANMKQIEEDLGTHSYAGRKAVEANLYAAAQAISTNISQGNVDAGKGAVALDKIMQKMGLSTQQGIAAINKLLDQALMSLGVSKSTIKALGNVDPSQISDVIAGAQQADAAGQTGRLGTGQFQAPHGGRNEAGGWTAPRLGGTRILAGESGYPEVTLSTNPTHAARSNSLLGQYMQRMSYAAGGVLSASELAKYNHVYAANSHVQLSPEVVVAMANTFGLPGTTFGQIVHGESDYEPGSVEGSEGPGIKGVPIQGWGLTQITTGVGNDAMIARLGGTRQLLNPLVNFRGAKELYDEAGGISPWHGTRYVTGAVANTVGQHISAAANHIKKISAPHVKTAGTVGALAQQAINVVTGAANSYIHAIAGSYGGVTGPVASTGTKHAHSTSSSGGVGGATAPGGSSILTPNAAWNPSHLQIASWIVPIMNWAEKHGFNGAVSSGYRSYATQAGLYNGAPGNGLIRGKTVAAPGTSNHEGSAYPRGAIDTPQFNLLLRVLSGYHGNPSLIGGQLPGDPVHFSATGHAAGARIGNAPWGGAPVPLVAHVGERIVNPMQWNAVARAAGTNSRGLDNYVGFDGTSKQSFAAGGHIQHGSSTSIFAPIPDLSRVDFNSLATIQQVFASVESGFDQMKTVSTKSGKFIPNFVSFVDSLTQEGGTLDRLSAAFQSYQTKLADSIIKAQYRTDKHGRVTNIQDPTTIDQLNINSLTDQARGLEGQRDIVNSALGRVRQRMASADKIKDKTKRKAVLDKLVAEYNNLIGRQTDLTDAIDQNIAQRWQTESQKVQDTVSNVNDLYSTIGAQLQSNAAGTGQSQLQTLGNFAALAAPGGADSLAAVLAGGQIEALQAPLKAAMKIGDTSTVHQIQQQIAGLQGTITQAIVQQIQDAQAAIDQSVQYTQSVGVGNGGSQTLQALAGVATSQANFGAAGQYTAQSLSLTRTALQTQLSGYNTLLGQAINAGDTNEVLNLLQAIDGLTGQLATNAQAIADNTAQVDQQISTFQQSRTSFQTGLLGGAAGILQTIGQTTGVTDIAGLKKLYTQSNAALGAGNANQAQGLAGFLSSSGVGGVPNLTGLSGASLVSAISGMNIPQIEAGQSQQWISTFENYINTIEQNDASIQQNTQQLATLNGQLNQPQQWSSTAWTAFRMAIFNGMGGLLPQYAATLPVGSMPNTPSYYTAQPNGASGGPTFGDVNITTPMEVLDPSVIGHQIAYETATALPTA